MRKLRFTLTGALAAGIAAVALSAPASASPPLAASGVESDVITLTFIKAADGNVFFSFVVLGSETGTFSGTHVSTGTTEVFKDGSFTFHGTVTFTGTVDGCGTGTVVFSTDGKGDPSGALITDHAPAGRPSAPSFRPPTSRS